MLFNRMTYIAIYILLLLGFTSCEKDKPITAHEDHIEAIGMALFDSSNNQIFSILRGITTDTLLAEVSKSQFMTAKFYNGNEELFDPGNDPDHTFNWEIEDNSLVEIRKVENQVFQIRIIGLKSGSTDIEFFIDHEGHADFRTGKFKLVVK